MAFLKEAKTWLGPWEQHLLRAIMDLGGFKNYHAHFDRAGMLDPKYYTGFDINPIEVASTMSLKAKQLAVGIKHDGVGYKNPADMESRLRECLENMIDQGVSEIVSFIDASPDIGLSAIKKAAELRKEYADKISFKIAAHPIFGYKPDLEKRRWRWSIFEEACEIADIVGALPEKDDRPDSVGADAHRRFCLALAISLGKPLHSHEDQTNIPSEHGTRDLIRAVAGMGSPRVKAETAPTVWAIHTISPSAYSENEFQDVVRGLVDNHIGVIYCPTAALSMRQHRDVAAPTHNSSPRILEMAAAGIEIRIGTDNLSDIFMPDYSTLLGEIKEVATVHRFYNIPVLAKFAAGVKLNQTNKDAIKLHLESARG